MNPKEFHDKLNALLHEVTEQPMNFSMHTQFIGIAEYALLTWKLSIATAVSQQNELLQATNPELKGPPEDHFGV